MISKQASQSQKVDFLIAGVQKGGTTTLDYYLRQHPQICMANRKEVHFFDNEKYFADDKTPDYDFYHSFFKPENTHQLLGESTPIYSYWKDSPKRIYNYNKQMKIILLLRNPIDRAYSHWNKETINFHSYPGQQDAAETLPFLQAIQTEKQRCLSAAPLQHRYYSYIDRGFYTAQLNRLMGLFPREQILVLKSEWLWNDAEKTLDKVCAFLGVEAMPLPEIIHNEKVNLAPHKASPVESPELNPVNIGNYKRPLQRRKNNTCCCNIPMKYISLKKCLTGTVATG